MPALVAVLPPVSARGAALAVLGLEAVAQYDRVVTFQTKFGHALERAYADAVGGRVGRPGEPDVLTRHGGFEFCTGANTKNSAGAAAQLAKVGAGRIVQVLGLPRAGRMSGAEFLRLHGVHDPAGTAAQLALDAAAIAAGLVQLELELV